MLADASNRSPWEDFAAFNQYSSHYHAAKRLGVESQFIYVPDEGHHILKPANSRVFYKEMLDWFAMRLR